LKRVAEGFTEEGAGVGESYPPEMRLNYAPVVRERRIVEVHRDDPGLPAAEAAEMDRWGEMSNLDGPLEFGGQVIGVLGIVESRYCRRFTEAEKLLFSQLAVLAAIAIHNADVFSVLEHLVITDGLTDLFNHRHFYDRLTQEAVRAARYGLPLSLLMIDIDDFKRYNDQFGHRAGDAVLRDLAVLLKGQTRQQIDVVARYGGEEFAVILPSTGLLGAATIGERLRRSIAHSNLAPDDGGPGAAFSAAERIRSAIADEVFGPPDLPASITVSVGVASYPLHAVSTDDLVDAADRAVYRAKERGKNRVEMAVEIAPA
jgi:diguanylate cyclase (GGDEF)-like protein